MHHPSFSTDKCFLPWLPSYKQYSDFPHDGIAFIDETVLIPADALEIRRTAGSVCEYPENALFSLEFA
jgi:hypothetical protein